MKKYTVCIGDREINIETGRLAMQAGGSVLVTMGDSVVLATACVSEHPREGIDFVPLVVDYLEKTFAAGKIPGGFFKREGRPSEQEVLVSRLIDRPIRPLLPKHLRNEVQIIATVLSMENDNSPAVMALLGASAALSISGAPFQGPIAAVRVARIDGNLLINPSLDDLSESEINMVVGGSRDGVVMVEGGAREVPEEEVLDAIMFGWEQMQPLIDIQFKMIEEVGKPIMVVEEPEMDETVSNRVRELSVKALEAALTIPGKVERKTEIGEVKEKVRSSFTEEELSENGKVISSTLREVEKEIVRGRILGGGTRIDGRGFRDVRDIWCETGLLKRAHGSALFTRGETQALAAATLGTTEDEQRVDALMGESSKRFMLHYNFPPYSVGEVRFLRNPARREIGHGALAERSLSTVLPAEEEFPYTIRVVSEIFSSNGSSSMATVCGSSLALMDAGVPIKEAVAGIAMGLIVEGENTVILSDILGDEDHLGDMDFKVAGTRKGVTAIQMDIKVKRVSRDILSRALAQAGEGRLHILEKMNTVLDSPRPDLSPYAPRFELLTIKTDKIGGVIGPGGKTIRGIIEETGVKIDIEDDGTVRIFGVEPEGVARAVKIVKDLTKEAEVGKSYDGIVKKIVDFGAFIEIFPGTEGLLHISQISHQRIRAVSDVFKEGDSVLVKVLEIDREGKIRLNRKDLVGKDDDIGGGGDRNPPRSPSRHRGKERPRS